MEIMNFYKNLTTEIYDIYYDKMPSLNSPLRHNANQWFKTLDKILNSILLDSAFWLEHWLNSDLHKPTTEEKALIKNAHINRLNEIQLVLAVSLKELIANDRENEPFTEFLHEYWLIGNEEMKSRGHETLDYDPFLIDVANKQTGKLINTQSKEKLRVSGEKCLFCQSTNIVSNGSMWQCKTCKRSFRKHN